MVEWSRAFGGAPMHLHEAEWPWVMRPDPCIRFWQGEDLALRGGLKLVRTGGQLEGYQVLHRPAGAGGKGALMAGDQPQICMGPKQLTFMYSYPNDIPLDGSRIRRIVECLDPLRFDRIYGAFFARGKGIIPTHGKEIVRRSADCYLRAIQGLTGPGRPTSGRAARPIGQMIGSPWTASVGPPPIPRADKTSTLRLPIPDRAQISQ
jgi:hypothetical protein